VAGTILAARAPLRILPLPHAGATLRIFADRIDMLCFEQSFER